MKRLILFSTIVLCMTAIMSIAPLTVNAQDAARVTKNINEYSYQKYGAYHFYAPNYESPLLGELISGRLYASQEGNAVTVTGNYFGDSNEHSCYWLSGNIRDPASYTWTTWTVWPSVVAYADRDVTIVWQGMMRGMLITGGTLIIQSGRLERLSGGNVIMESGIINHSIDNPTSSNGCMIEVANLTINGGEMITNRDADITHPNIHVKYSDYSSSDGTLVMNNGQVTAEIIEARYSYINGGTITGNLHGRGIPNRIEMSGGTVNGIVSAERILINGGNVVTVMGRKGTHNEVKITGGYVDNLIATRYGYAAYLSGTVESISLEESTGDSDPRLVEVSTLEIPTSWNNTSNGLTAHDGQVAPTWDLSGDVPKIKFDNWTSIEWGTKITGNGIDNISQIKTVKAWTQNGILHVSGLTGNESIKIIDLTGNILVNNQYPESGIDVSYLPSGIYLLQIVLPENKVISQKFVKK